MAKRRKSPQEELTMSLYGDVSSSEFARAAAALDSILRGLNEELVPGTKVDWLISGLVPGSSSQSVMALCESPAEEQAAAAVAEAFDRTGDCMERGLALPFRSSLVTAGVESVRGLVHGRIIRAVFASPRADHIVAGAPSVDTAAISHHVAFGALRGNVMALSGRDSLRFVLYDLADDHPVHCYLGNRPQTVEQLRRFWRNGVVEVEGLIRRDAFDGSAISIRDVQRLELVEKQPYDWVAPMGALKGFLLGESSEDVVRRNRDG